MPSKDSDTITVRMSNADVKRIKDLADREDTTVGMIVKGLIRFQFDGVIDYKSGVSKEKEYERYEKACRKKKRDPLSTIELITEQILES